MDHLWSETCWSTFKCFIILIASTYYILCISWIIKCLIIIDARCKHEDSFTTLHTASSLTAYIWDLDIWSVMLLGTRWEGKKILTLFSKNKLQLSLQRKDSIFDSIWPHGCLTMLYIQHCFPWITKCKLTNLQPATVDTSHSGAIIWHWRRNDTHTDKISDGRKSVFC